MNAPSAWRSTVAVALIVAGPGTSQALVYKGRRYYADTSRVALAEARKRAAKRDVDAILMLGARNDTESSTLLKRIARADAPTKDELAKAPHPAALRYRFRDSSIAARMALARMGDRAYTGEFVAGLSSDDTVWRTECFFALGYIGDRAMVGRLGAMLDQDQLPPTPPGYASDIVFASNSSLAQSALAEILPDVRRSLEADWKKETKRDNYRPASSELWKWWWARNKSRYE